MPDPISKCPECGAYRYEHSKTWHAPECRENSPEQLRLLLNQYVDAWRKLELKDRSKETYWRGQCKRATEQVALFQGKCRVLKHENNKLRKKLFPGKA